MSVKIRLIAAALALVAPAALAADYKVGAIEIKNPWAPATPGGAKVAAGYFTITNTGASPDRLVAVTATVAGRSTLHEMSMANGIMRMRPVTGIDLKPGQTVELNPDSFHVMLENLKQPLKQGDTVKGTLTFEKAGTVDIEFAVGSIGGKAPAAAPAGGMKMDHMH
jgi:copper(I)-binding protein